MSVSATGFPPARAIWWLVQHLRKYQYYRSFESFARLISTNTSRINMG